MHDRLRGAGEPPSVRPQAILGGNGDCGYSIERISDWRCNRSFHGGYIAFHHPIFGILGLCILWLSVSRESCGCWISYAGNCRIWRWDRIREIRIHGDISSWSHSLSTILSINLVGCRCSLRISRSPVHPASPSVVPREIDNCTRPRFLVDCSDCRHASIVGVVEESTI
jgi:hypothetical protein